GVGLIGEWLTQSNGAVIEAVVGVALLTCAAPTSHGLTVGERVRIAVDFLLRTRWTSIRTTRRRGALTVMAHGETTTRVFELQHRGRLDLSGRDRENALALADFADAMAASDETRHFSLHVCST